MERKRTLIIAGLGLGALAVIAALTYSLWAGSTDDRPTLMYFLRRSLSPPLIEQAVEGLVSPGASAAQHSN